MTIILAEISGGEWVMLSITGGMFVINLIGLLKKQQVAVQQPIDVQMVEHFVPKNDFNAHLAENKREHEMIFSKIGGVDRGNGEKISREVIAIHARINLLDKSSGRLEAATEFQNQQLAQMDSKITRLLERK